MIQKFESKMLIQLDKSFYNILKISGGPNDGKYMIEHFINDSSVCYKIDSPLKSISSYIRHYCNNRGDLIIIRLVFENKEEIKLDFVLENAKNKIIQHFKQFIMDPSKQDESYTMSIKYNE